MKPYVFVYAKDKVIKVLDTEESIQLHKTLIKNGWKHTATLNACTFIEYLHNMCGEVDLFNEVKELSITNQLNIQL